MTGLTILMDLTKEPLDEKYRGKINEGARIVTIGGMPAGTKDGKATVALIVELEDGGAVFAETTLALMITAVDALRIRYPESDPKSPEWKATQFQG
jgi:hypothetical protein